MTPTGLHLLLTYQCTLECDHCFVWGSPEQRGTMTLRDLRKILRQARDLGTIQWIFFEGGEPFLFYPLLVRGVKMASRQGFKVGIVSNGYWATTMEDAVEWLKPMKGKVQDLSVSSDSFHWKEEQALLADNARAAAKKLGIPIGFIAVAQPEQTQAAAAIGQLPPGESGVMYRGRATVNLIARAPRSPWTGYTRCPYENLRSPERVHVDPLGYVHICQGISLGNLFRTPLREIFERYDPDSHPVAGPLLAGGPTELVHRYDLQHQEAYADACHLCYEARLSLRSRFPDILIPDQVYGPAKAPA